MTEKVKETTSKAVRKANALLLPISRSHGDLGKVTNVTLTWKKLCEELFLPRIDNVTTEKYRKLPVTEQHKRKNQGYIVGGTFKGRARKRNELVNRTVLTLDIDQCSQAMLDEFLNPMWSPLAEYEYAVHSTRNHTKDAPRIRVVIPIAKPISSTQYEAISRILAWHIDSEMGTVDPVSFKPSQVMYLPSINKDADFIKFRNETGLVLDVDDYLTKNWPQPWQHSSAWPLSHREPEVRQALDKAPDPRTKPGLIGAFCRLYNIHEAISKFLPDIYAPGSEPDRYSYIPGHTRDGVVVYDEATYIYSHHGTDPCGGRLVNGLDMVRIHKFGHLDSVESIEEAEGNITKLPSHKAMMEFVTADEAVVREAAANYYDEDAIMADMLPDTEVASEVTTVEDVVDDSWKDKLKRFETSGKYQNSYRNILLILSNDPRIKGCLGFNEFNSRVVMRKRIRSKHVSLPPLIDKINGDSVTEQVVVALRTILEGDPKEEGGYDLKVTERDLTDAIQAVVTKNHFHPVRDYLRSLKWDGKKRMHKLLGRYFGAADTPLHEVFSRSFMIASVQRVFEPGCKFDHVLILRGPQGIRKSGGLRALAGDTFFGELRTPRLEDTAKVTEQLLGKWIVEIPELSQFNRSEIEVIKALFSAQSEYVRLAWARGAREYPRQNTFSGTSNKEHFLKDDTGNRRFWPVVLSEQVDTAGIERDRDQLWAEAYQEYLLMRLDHDHAVLPLSVPEHLLAEVASVQEAHLERPYEWLTAEIEAWLDTPVPEEQAALGWRPTDDDLAHSGRMVLRDKTCLKDVAQLCLGRPDFDARAAKDIVAAMRSLPNWYVGPQLRIPGQGRQTVYYRRK